MMVRNAKPMLDILLEPMRADDYVDVARIFTQGIISGNATYDTIAGLWQDWDAIHLQHSRWVAKASVTGRILGWVALSGVSSRCVYSGVAELSIYIDTDFLGRGLGDALMACVVASSESNGIWTLQSGIFPENLASIRLHQKYEFRLVGERERLGQMQDGRWRDVLLLERRSRVIGL